MVRIGIGNYCKKCEDGQSSPKCSSCVDGYYINSYNFYKGGYEKLTKKTKELINNLISKEEMIERWRAYKGVPQELELPSAPKNFIQYFEEENRPQPKLDVDYENGMGVSLGRLREDSIFDYKFVVFDNY